MSSIILYKHQILLACLLAVTITTEMNSEAETNIQAPHDQDVAEIYRRGFYGRIGGHGRGRRSVNDVTPERDFNLEIVSDQNGAELHGRR